MSSARHCDVNFSAPRTFAFKILYTEFVSVIFNLVTTGSAHFKKIIDLFFCHDSVGIVNVSVRTGNCNNFTAELSNLLNSTPSNVTETGNCNCFALDVFAESVEHFNYVVNSAETCCFRTDKRTAEGKAFTCQNACEFVAKAFVLTEHITNFSCTNADVTCRNVCVSTDVFGKFCHETLAETHNFVVGLASGVKVGTTFTATHRKTGKRVFKCLFKT